MCMILVEGIVLKPLCNAQNADFLDLGSNRPTDLEGRTLLAVAGAGGRASIFDRSAGICWNVHRLVETFYYCHSGEIHEISSSIIIHEHVDLGLDPKLRVLDGFAQT